MSHLIYSTKSTSISSFHVLLHDLLAYPKWKDRNFPLEMAPFELFKNILKSVSNQSELMTLSLQCCCNWRKRCFCSVQSYLSAEPQCYPQATRSRGQTVPILKCPLVFFGNQLDQVSPVLWTDLCFTPSSSVPMFFSFLRGLTLHEVTSENLGNHEGQMGECGYL